MHEWDFVIQGPFLASELRLAGLVYTERDLGCAYAVVYEFPAPDAHRRWFSIDGVRLRRLETVGSRVFLLLFAA